MFARARDNKAMSESDPMMRAMEIAMQGRGNVEPNPMVGCVLVRDGQIIAEGYHQRFGGPHAEVNALAACADPTGATAYVTLEPCCPHEHKKTPACAPALIAAKVSRVVAACLDPNPLVCGKGLNMLSEAGITVEEGLRDEEARQLNAAYFKALTQRRPYVILKWAQSADGKIAGAGGKRVAIGNSASQELVHQLRSRCDAILVGIGTALADDPMLTARVSNPRTTPLRIVLDSRLRLGMDSQIIRTAKKIPTVICCSQATMDQNADLVSELNTREVEVLPIPADEHGGLSLEYLLDELGKRGLVHLLVEPGRKLADSFLKQNLADRVWIFRSPQRIDAPKAPAAAAIKYPSTGKLMLEGDELTEYLNPRSKAFYAKMPSADFELEQRSIPARGE
jgi:diaminohydroxyphosphoribosylaminopyrimidine deaminase / 5-amino-6-(5-phosphoribosylamino)uracil reductase